MVGQEDEGGVDRGLGHGARRRGEARGEARRDGGVPVAVVGGVRADRGDQRGRRTACRPRHGRRPQVGAERVVGAGHHQRPAHAVEGLDERAGAEVGRVPVAALLGFDPPEELGDLLEAGALCQLGRALPPVQRPELLVELGHGGGDGGEPGRGLPAAPAPRGQDLDVGQVEQAAPGSGVAVRLQQAAADVGVKGRHLDAEAAGRLLGGEHAFHPVDFILT